MKNIKILMSLMMTILVFSSCEKETQHKVSYFVTNSQAGFSANYYDENGQIISKSFTTHSKNDKIVLYTYYAEPGDIVYVSAKDTTATSFIQVMIYLDGKVYKEASRTDNTTMPVTVSGTVPY